MKYEDYLTGKMWDNISADTIINDNKDKKITVPTVVLTSSITESAAEDFLIYLSNIDNIITIGQKTNGSSGESIYFILPGGGLGSVCAKRDTYPDGKDFVGYGIKPDIEIKITVESYIAGKDIVLEKGIEILKKEIE